MTCGVCQIAQPNITPRGSCLYCLHFPSGLGIFIDLEQQIYEGALRMAADVDNATWQMSRCLLTESAARSPLLHYATSGLNKTAMQTILAMSTTI